MTRQVSNQKFDPRKLSDDELEKQIRLLEQKTSSVSVPSMMSSEVVDLSAMTDEELEQNIKDTEQKIMLGKANALAESQKFKDLGTPKYTGFLPKMVQEQLPGPEKVKAIGRMGLEGTASVVGGTETVGGLSAGLGTLTGHLYDRFFGEKPPERKVEDEPIYNYLSDKKQKEDFKRRFEAVQAQQRKQLPWSDILDDVKESALEAMNDEEIKNEAARIVSGKSGFLGELSGEMLGATFALGAAGRRLDKLKSGLEKGSLFLAEKIPKVSKGFASTMAKAGAEVGLFTVPLAVGDNIKEIFKEAVKDDPNYLKTLSEQGLNTGARVTAATILGMGLPAAGKAIEKVGEKFGAVFDKFYFQAMETLTGVPQDISYNFFKRNKEINRLVKKMSDDPGLIGPMNQIKEEVFEVLNTQRKYLNEAVSESLKNANSEMLGAAKSVLPVPIDSKVAGMRVMDFDPVVKTIKEMADKRFHKVFDKESIKFIEDDVLAIIKEAQDNALRESSGGFADKLMDQAGSKMVRPGTKFLNPEEALTLKQRIGSYLKDFYDNPTLFKGDKKKLQLFLNDIYKGLDDAWDKTFPSARMKEINQYFTKLHDQDIVLRKIYSEKAALNRTFNLANDSTEAAYTIKQVDENTVKMLQQFDDLVGADSIAKLQLERAAGGGAGLSQQAMDIKTARYFGPGGPGNSFLPVDATGKSVSRILFSQGLFGAFGMLGVPFKLTQGLATFTTSPLMFKWGIKMGLISKEAIETISSKMGVEVPTNPASLEAFMASLNNLALDEMERIRNQNIQKQEE